MDVEPLDGSRKSGSTGPASQRTWACSDPSHLSRYVALSDAPTPSSGSRSSSVKARSSQPTREVAPAARSGRVHPRAASAAAKILHIAHLHAGTGRLPSNPRTGREITHVTGV